MATTVERRSEPRLGINAFGWLIVFIILFQLVLGPVGAVVYLVGSLAGVPAEAILGPAAVIAFIGACLLYRKIFRWPIGM